jgi:putative N6-adenine-specific DNA methylase
VTVEAGGVSWRGDEASLYAANLHLRTATRVLVRVADFRARTFFELERHVRRADWARYLAPGQPVRLRVTTRKSRLYHKRAIEERFARELGEILGSTVEGGGEGGEEEEEVERSGRQAQLFVIRFDRDRCVVSADASGERLHRRGYRQAVARAPLRETLASAMLLASGWKPGDALLDPLCGSGTIPIEAALIARNIPPALANPDLQPRSFAFERWPTFEPAAWDRVVGDARSAILDTAASEIRGSDRDAGAVDSAIANATRAGVEADLFLERLPLSAASPSASSGWLITNPPYGVRIGDAPPLRDLYAALGNLLRTRLPRWRLALLASEDNLARHTGLPLTERLRTTNGGIPVKLLASPSGGPS